MTQTGTGPEILFVIGSFEVGGTERHLAAIVGPLIALGWRVTVYGISGDGPMRAEFERTGAIVVLPPAAGGRERRSLVWRAVRIFRVTCNLLGVLIRRRPSIVHMFLPSAYALSGPLAIITRIPIRVMSRRSLNVYRKERAVVWWLEQRLHSHMTAILGNSQSVVRQLRDEEGVPEQRLGLIYNGVETQKFSHRDARPAVRTKLGLAPTAFVMVIVANLIPYKGHHELIEALGTIDSKLPPAWRLLVVGEDYGVAGGLKARARMLGIDQKISFLGMRNDISDMLLAADVGLLCSHQEGFSNAVLEGMAAGLPMVVTDVGGNREAVVDGENGFVVPARDPTSLADAIVRLADDHHLRSKFGSAGRDRVAALFSQERCVKSYDALYRWLLAGRLPGDLAQVGVTN